MKIVGSTGSAEAASNSARPGGRVVDLCAAKNSKRTTYFDLPSCEQYFPIGQQRGCVIGARSPQVAGDGPSPRGWVIDFRAVEVFRGDDITVPPGTTCDENLSVG